MRNLLLLLWSVFAIGCSGDGSDSSEVSTFNFIPKGFPYPSIPEDFLYFYRSDAFYLHEAILLTQRKVRLIRTNMPFVVPTIESILLSHLAYDPTRNSKDLSDLLGFTKTKISRILYQQILELML